LLVAVLTGYYFGENMKEVVMGVACGLYGGLLKCIQSFGVSRDSAGDIATGYGVDGPGIESRWRRYLPDRSIPALGPTQPPIKLVPGLSRG